MPLIRKDPDPPAVLASAPVGAITGTTDQRWATARALGSSMGDVANLASALRVETDARVREAIFTSLARAGSLEAIAAIVPSLRSDDASVRTGALDALRSIPALAAPIMPDLLADPDPDVRLLACEIVRELPQDQVVSLLSELLDREDQANVCASALEVLADAGSADALPALQRCAERFAGDPFLGFAIRMAIDRLGDQAARHGG